MKKINLSGKRVTIMGLGLQGQGLWAAKVASRQKAKVTVTDLRTAKDLAPSLKKLEGLPIRYVLGRHQERDFIESDLVVRNPSVPNDSKFLKIARAAKVPIEMEIGLFFLLAPIQRKNLIGVTGTRGKTTTTVLISRILAEAGLKSVVGGNIPQKPALSLLSKVEPKTTVVLELSSWQLEGLAHHRISPHIGVITNVYRDHLNRYQSMADYITAKKLIFAFQKPGDFLVLNQENKQSKQLAQSARSRVRYFSSSQLQPSLAAAVKLKGKHNLANAAAAAVVAKLKGIDQRIIKKAFQGFQGLPSRLEFVRKVEGVSFYNDTCSTIPEATMAALETFKQPIILIAGGADKKLHFGQLGQRIKNSSVRSIVLLGGDATDKLEKVLDKKIIQGQFNDLKKAVLKAKSLARPGEIVLLSPACTSFSMFKNEFERGDKFRKIVKSFKG
ncbi:MAG TPA: UDP-N-acetylmuramoyl-L-alanine--D-glutamate ligase [Candidatus Bathyarchaeia archaeon]|nr:UDP-N-acetylmuramoyl-L-alanine--D-glutamate ligase [Candidatus Bathyarchaeia archaeon]